jgi:diaminopimelate decarboxylase
MKNILAHYTAKNNFYGTTNPIELVAQYGSPLYVYNENILRERCRELKNLVEYPNFAVNFSAKANGNLSIMKIVREEGLRIDALSPGELFAEFQAGFKPEEILYVSNNVSAEEMRHAIDAGVTVSVDSVSQLETFGKINAGGRVAIRFNPGVGAGHHEKVVTGGKGTKFGVDEALIPDVKRVLKKYNLQLIGINQHIGSLFMDDAPYIGGVQNILHIAKQFPDLAFIDLGGGFGIPYYKQDGEARLDLKDLGRKLDPVLYDFAKTYGKNILFKIEPGRYVVAECGVLLGTVHAIKTNHGDKYIGTDIGFNILSRPILYESHHDIEVYRKEGTASRMKEAVTVVGNICETGDVIAKHRLMPKIQESDILGILDAGAYGYAMASNYNNRPRPAEVLIQSNGEARLVRRRDSFEDMMRNFV